MSVESYEATLSGDHESHASEGSPAPQGLEIPKLEAKIALWLVLFVFGGGLLTLYYAGIDYFPEVAWQDTLTFMALMTIIGGSLLVAYSFLLFVPGAIWSEFLIFDVQLREVLMMSARRWEPCVWSVTKRIIFPFAVFMAFCHFLLYEDGPLGFVPLGAAASLVAVSYLLERDLRQGLERVARRKQAGRPPIAPADPDTKTLRWHRISIGASHFPLFLAFIAKVEHWGYPASTLLWTLALLPFASCAGLLLESRFKRWLSDSPSVVSAPPPGRPAEAVAGQVQIPDKLSLLCRSIFAFDSAALLSLMALWFFHRIYEESTLGIQGDVPASLLVLCTLVVILANLAVSVLFHQHRRQALLASFLAALLLLGAGQLLGTKAEAALPAKIMEKFGFGGQSAMLVVTEKGGRLLCLQGIPVEFEDRKQSNGVAGADDASSADAPQETPGGQEKTAKSKPREVRFARAGGLTILSRLGSDYLLRYEEQTTITLPKGEVVSWSTHSKGRAPVNGCKPQTSTPGDS